MLSVLLNKTFPSFLIPKYISKPRSLFALLIAMYLFIYFIRFQFCLVFLLIIISVQIMTDEIKGKLLTFVICL